jgi:hypothetical protein
MADIEWYRILVILIILIIGGVIGAWFQAGISVDINQKPSISTRVDFFSKFKDTIGCSCLFYFPIITDGKESTTTTLCTMFRFNYPMKLPRF